MHRRLPSATLPLSLFLVAGLAGLPSSLAAGDWRLVSLPGAALGAVALPASPLGSIDVSAADAVFHSTDRGKTFSQAPLFGSCLGNTSLILVPDPVHAGTLYATAGSRVVKSLDGGVTWLTATSPGVGWLVDLQAAPGVLVAVGDSSVLPPLSPRPPCYPSDSGVALSTDGGVTWRAPIQAFAGTGVNSAIAVDPVHPERIYLGTSAGYASVSLDGGVSEVELPAIGGLRIDWLRVDTSTAPAALFASSAAQLFRMPLTADGRGTSWTRLDRAPFLTADRSVSVIFDPDRPGTLYAFSTHGVFTSTDRGDSWTAIPGTLDPAAITGLALDPRPNGPLYAATLHGLYALDRSLCVEDAAGACLNGFRFKVGISFATPGAPAAPAHAQALSADTADFWFFSPGNLELLLKVLDGRSVNHAFWVFAGGLSDVAYTITVTDTETGAVETYAKPASLLQSFADTKAFPDDGTGGKPATGIAAAPLAPPVGGCATNTTLCLAGSRFQVSVAYQAGPFAGAGQAVPLTGDTGAFWFLSSSNLELLLKVLDGRGLNGHFWIFYGALSDVAYTITVTDTTTGAMRTYTNPQGHLASFADTSAF
jgi:hypothetical protein